MKRVPERLHPGNHSVGTTLEYIQGMRRGPLAEQICRKVVCHAREVSWAGTDYDRVAEIDQRLVSNRAQFNLAWKKACDRVLCFSFPRLKMRCDEDHCGLVILRWRMNNSLREAAHLIEELNVL